MSDAQGPGAEQRSESPLERLDRNTVELINELRVAGTGIQVLFAFLLIVPFNNRFPRLSRFERSDYFVTLVCIAISAVLMIAPSIHHRLLFRRGEKAFLVDTGSRLLVVASAFLGLGMTGIMLLIGEVVIGTVGAILVALATAGLIIGLWFALPLAHRRRSPEADDDW